MIALLNSSGTAVVQYTYDAWGKLLSTTGPMASILGQLNPLRYRGYVYDQETGLYYLQSRYYNPEIGRFINADVFASTGQGILGNNMFAYCLNNPVNLADPTGKIAITTLILIGSVIVGVGCAGYTAYTTYQAGWDTADILWYTLGSGLSGFLTVYTLGMSAYQMYINYCTLNSITPVTQVGAQPSVADQLQTCADSANSSVSGNGPVAGSKKHTVFASEVNALGNGNLKTETSYLGGYEVPYGTKGSIRFDVLQLNAQGAPIAAWDLKTGKALLTASRVLQMQNQSGLNIPIHMVK